MISINGLVKKYGALLAVDGLNLEVPTEELFGFIGPNGAGKTRTIKLLVGSLKPSSGTIQIDDVGIKQDPIRVKRSFAKFPTDLFFSTN
jgi:ABC-2 type transport system ATP-binding protein